MTAQYTPEVQDLVGQIVAVLPYDGGDSPCWAALHRLATLAGPMVDMQPPATARDRWMYEQGRLAERDSRTHVPIGYISTEQLSCIKDLEDGEVKLGNYIPMRKTAAGLFQQPIYTNPIAAVTAVLDRCTQEDLHKFIDVAAGEGLVLGGIDAADLYVRLFPARYVAALDPVLRDEPTDEDVAGAMERAFSESKGEWPTGDAAVVRAWLKYGKVDGS